MSVESILQNAKVIAIVGLSADTQRPSNGVAAYLKREGYRIVPVNPKENRILGERCYPSLASINEKIDIVDIFRRSDEVEALVDEAIKKGVEAVWMQEGVVNEKAAKKARDAGLEVIMDMCIMKEHRKMIKKGK